MNSRLTAAGKECRTDDEYTGNQESFRAFKKLIRKCYINWMCFNLSLYQPETMQAPAMVKMFGDIREDLYPNDPQKQQELMARHLPFFNTEPFIGCLIPGITLGMEAEKARGEDIQKT